MAMAKLSTHVLDIAQGKPAAGVKVALFSVTEQGKVLIKMEITNDEGRCSAPLLEGDAMKAGQYELVFNAGDYFAAQGIALPTPRFIDLVTLAFGIADAGQNYHVPLVVSPWSYSTYRGS
jgi:5-hydroxyisourate hydrolase